MIDLRITIIYCLCDDLLKSLSVKDDPQCRMSTAEIMTVALVSAFLFRGNIQMARCFLKTYGHIPKILSHSRINRKLLAIPSDRWQALFVLIKTLSERGVVSTEFAVDSFPMPACHPCRSWRCRLYQGKKFLGYCAAKKLHYYGLKVHVIISTQGLITELIFTPASWADITGLQAMNLDLPSDAILYGDRAYSSITLEEELAAAGPIRLIAQRKRKSTRPHPQHLEFLRGYYRKSIETAFSQILRQFPRAIVARSSAGFELRILLFVAAYSIERYCKVLG